MSSMGTTETKGIQMKTAKIEPWNETVPSSDIRLTSRALAMRWEKKTVMDGLTATVSFHASEYRKWVTDMKDVPALHRAIADGRAYYAVYKGKYITLTPPGKWK